MAITARRLRRLEAWSDWAAAGGARTAVVDDAIAVRASTNLENQTLTVTLPLDSPAAPLLAARKIIRVEQDDVIYDEYRIIDRGTDDDQSSIIITASPFRLSDLQSSALISRKDGDGVIIYDFEVLGLTPTEVMTNWVLPALAAAGFGWVSVGRITPTQRLDMTFAWDTPLAVLIRLATATLCELDIRRTINASKPGGVGAWDTQFYSAVGFKGSARMAARTTTDPTSDQMIGLSLNPTHDASFEWIDYAWYAANGNLQIYENGVSVQGGMTWAPGDLLEIIYSGTTIQYLKNGVLMRQYLGSITAGLTFWLDSSHYSPIKSGWRDIQFGPADVLVPPLVPLVVTSPTGISGLSLTSGYAVDLVTKVNNGAQTADLRVDKNLINITKSETSIDQSTRVFPSGADMGDGMKATMANATWRVAAISGLDLVLEDPAGGAAPIQFDGQLAGADDVSFANLEARWTFDADASDYSGNGHAGTLQNGAYIASPPAGGAKIGGALQLDGLNDYVEVADTASLRYTGGDLTLAGWISSNEAGLGEILSKPWNGSGDYNYYIFYNGGAGGALIILLGGATTWQLAFLTVVPKDGKFHHIAVTVATNKVVRCYVDGVLSNSDIHTITSWSPPGGNAALPLAIGTVYPYGSGWAGDVNQAFNGAIDDLRIYRRVLSASEIAALALPPFNVNPAYLRKIDGSLVQVLGSTAPNLVRVASASGITVGDAIQFRANAVGDDLTALEAPAAVGAYGIKSAIRDVSDVPATNNLVKNPAMRAWPGSSSAPPTNWTAVGAPTIAKQTAAPFTAIGGQSIKVTSTADAQGVISDAVAIFPTVLKPYLSGYAKIWVASGNARVELVITTPSGTKIFPLLPDRAAPTSLGQWFDVGAAGYDANADAATAAAIRVVQNGTAASVFYVDAAQITQSSTQQPWFEGSGGTRLWQEANEALRIGSSPVVSYAVPLVDLENADPIMWNESALIIGANAHIVDARLGIDIVTRIVGVERDYVNPQATAITLSNRFDDLTDILATTTRADRATAAVPETLTTPQQPKLTASFDINGQLIINSAGDYDVTSHKIAWATGSAPSAATVRAASPINQQNISGLATGSTYIPGTTVFVAAFAYNARGFESAPLTVISVSREGAIIDYTPFASTLTPVKLVSVNPGSGAFNGEIIYNTTDHKLYRWNGSAWDSSVATVDLSGQISTAQIANLAVTAAQIGANAVIAGKIAADAVGSAEIAASAVTTSELAALAVTTAKIAALAVTTTELAALAVTTAKMATLSVDSSILAASAVIDTKIATDAVTTPKILAGSVTAAKIAAHTITANEITALTITAAEIAANTITAAKIAALTITASEIAATTITGGKLVAGTITANELAALSVTTGKLAANAVTAAQIAAHTITANEITALTITAAELAAGSVIAAKIGAGEVTAGKIAALSITAAEIAAATITGAKIAAGTITASNITANTITAGQIQAGAIGTTELAALAVTAAKIAAGTITAAQIAAGTITANEIAALTITAAKIVAGTITLTQMSHVRGKWHRGANTAIANVTDTKAIIDTADIDPNSMYDAAGGGFKIPAGTATAFYLVRAYVKWDGTAGGTNANGTRQIYLMKNGSPMFETAVTGKPLIAFRGAGGGLEQVTSWFGQLAAGDPVCVGGYQDSGGGLNFAVVYLEVIGWLI